MEEFKEAIDWEWKTHDGPSKFPCVLDPIEIDPAKAKEGLEEIIKFRLNKTANECVVEAIKAVRAGNRSEALKWLMAGQCHNLDGHRKDIKNAGDAAIDYAVEKYGPQVPE